MTGRNQPMRAGSGRAATNPLYRVGCPRGYPICKTPRLASRGVCVLRPGSALAGLDRLGELRRDLEEVTDDAEVGDLEDRRLFVLVDGDDRLRRLHARAV